MAGSLDLITIFLGLELLSIASYARRLVEGRSPFTGGFNQVLSGRCPNDGCHPVRYFVALRPGRDDQPYGDRRGGGRPFVAEFPSSRRRACWPASA